MSELISESDVRVLEFDGITVHAIAVDSLATAQDIEWLIERMQDSLIEDVLSDPSDSLQTRG